jgi:hypothetical protein
MKITVFSLTTDGDNTPISTEVYATEEEARQALIDALETWGVRRAHDGFPLSTAPIDELCDLYEHAADGMACIEQHDLEIAI